MAVSVNSALTYQRRRNGISLGFVRGLSGGSGVFLGATTNTVTFGDRYQFTRYWTGSVNGGYALNNSLAPAGVATTQFDNWFVGANLGRQMGQHAAIDFNYGRDEAEQSHKLPGGALRWKRASTNGGNIGKLAFAPGCFGRPDSFDWWNAEIYAAAFRVI